MKNKFIITTIIGLGLTGGLLAFANNQAIELVPAKQNLNTTKINEPTPVAQTTAKSSEYTTADVLDVVAQPDQYLNKKIKFRAAFDKFSTLGLDYKPAFRDSEKYISFLIKRPDVTDHTIPLSEMKIFITRSEAEKFIELDSGDIIEVYGNVFSDALTDAWVDVNKLVVVEKKNKDEKKK